MILTEGVMVGKLSTLAQSCVSGSNLLFSETNVNSLLLLPIS